MQKISRFSGEFEFLSNFYKSPMLIAQAEPLPPVTVPTLEHAYQALKAKSQEDVDYILASPTPGIAKRRGQKIETWTDWDKVKDDAMLELLRTKFFGNVVLGQMLIDTGKAYLEEGNTWGDTYWGVCRGIGENMLGTLLMQVRTELTEGIQHSTYRGLDFPVDSEE